MQIRGKYASLKKLSSLYYSSILYTIICKEKYHIFDHSEFNLRILICIYVDGLKYKKMKVVLNVVTIWLSHLENGTNMHMAHSLRDIYACRAFSSKALSVKSRDSMTTAASVTSPGDHMPFFWRKVKIPVKYCFPILF